MAGYLFNLKNNESLVNSITTGVYSTILSSPINNKWIIHHEATFADFSSMKEGDHVYFFTERLIYGIGVLRNINGDCKFLNYPDANKPNIQCYKRIQKNLLLDMGKENSINCRFICTFVPSPFFFKKGVDMDEALSSSPNSFKIIRALWKRSFIKFTDDENQALKNILLRKNLYAIVKSSKHNVFENSFSKYHNRICKKTQNDDSYKLNITPFLNTINKKDGSLKHEMAIEAALIHQISYNDKQTVTTFGTWDYISHQVIASPFKPIDYMDKMDVFGYSFIPHQKPTIHKFLIVEIKKGKTCEKDIIQLMKYVEWVKNEYAFGDYRMINAFLVGFSFSEKALRNITDLVERKYIYGVRPPDSAIWNNVKLIKYTYNHNSNKVDFNIEKKTTDH